MKLPNSERVMIDSRKLSEYCLNPTHARGRHKARVFERALGLTLNDAQELYDALFAAAQGENAISTERDEHGQRYVVEFEMVRGDKRAWILSGWIVRPRENFARLTTCYVIAKGTKQ